MGTSSADVVPFGKYRGQPLAVMMADQQYCEWLASQGWFAEKSAPTEPGVSNPASEQREKTNDDV